VALENSLAFGRIDLISIKFMKFKVKRERLTKSVVYTIAHYW